MSENLAILQRKIDSAGQLQSVVRTMKALAASSIGQYEKSVLALADYYRTVELGLGVCLRSSPSPLETSRADRGPIGVIVFGSDQGLVGEFNEALADYAIKTVAALSDKPAFWTVGERVRGHIAAAGLPLKGILDVPNSVNAITPLVGQIQIEVEAANSKAEFSSVYIFFNRPLEGALYEPTGQRLLPLDAEWRASLVRVSWPSRLLPQNLEDTARTLHALTREYLFISLFRACALSLASENASRLGAMQRAEKNIQELQVKLQSKFHRLRQNGIDEELFDVSSGFEALIGVAQTGG